MIKKKILKILSFFKPYERYFVLVITTCLLVVVVMQASVNIYKLEVPKTAWAFVLENASLVGVIISILIFSIEGKNRRKNDEKMVEVKERAEIVTRQKDLENKITGQQEVDKRLDHMLLALQAEVKQIQSDLGRVTAQICQLESEAELRRRMNEVEQLINKLQSSSI